VTKLNDWPLWLQLLVMAPHCALVGAGWFYTPKSKQGERWLWLIWAYLIAFFLVMYFVFGYR
jgi:hypothetical protein